MGLNKPIIITNSSVDISNLATKSDLASVAKTSDLSGLAKTTDLANIKSGVVKHIQRGRTTDRDYGEISVSLSGFTDLSKMVVIFNSSADEDAAATITTITNLSLTTLKYKSNTGWNGIIYYQVIEFY